MARPVDLPSYARAALLLAGLVAIGAGLSHLGLKPAGGGTTARDAATFVATGATLAAIGLPRQAVCFAAGYGFGAIDGAALALAAQTLGCAASFFWARLVARDWARRFIARRAETGRVGRTLARGDRLLAANPFSATLTLRLLPVGNNLALNLLAGASAVPAPAFIFASLVGYLPQTLVFALAGSGVHVNRGVELGLGVALFAASAALGTWLLRRLPGA